jgi:hypothetical protein
VLHVNDGVTICFELGNIQYWLIGVKFPNVCFELGNIQYWLIGVKLSNELSNS